MVDSTIITNFVNALLNKFENKVANKKDSISGDYSSDSASYPTVKAVKNFFGTKVTKWSTTVSNDNYPSEKLVKDNLDAKGTKVTSWSGTVSDDNYPSEKLAKDTLDTKLDIAQGSGASKINKNVVTDDSGNITLENKPTIPTKTSNLTNDGDDGINAFVKNNDSRLNDARTPTSHTHGNITNDGKVGSTANKPLITTTGGSVTTGSFGNTANSFCEGNDSRLSDARTPTSHMHGNVTNDGKIGSTSGKIVTTGTNGTLVATEDLSSLGGVVSISKQETAETGYIATYVISQGGTALSPKINIPMDYLVKSGTVKTCTVKDQPIEGLNVGDKYLDFVVNVKTGSGTDEHIYISVKDLTDVYTADESTLTLSNGQFKVKNGGVTTTQLSSGVNTSLGYADAWNSSPASGITSSDITAWNGKSNLTINDVDGEIEDYLTAITNALTT